MNKRRNIVDYLRSAKPAILPSLLLCDFRNLEREIGLLDDAGVKALHLDIMDGVFVPNFSYGLTIVEAIGQLTKLPIDAHLMMVHPDKYIDAFRDAGADLITIHAEAIPEPVPVLERIRKIGAAAGLAINPRTPVSAIEHCLPSCDLMLVMSVEAGFGGQSFDASALNKLSRLRELGGDELLLEIDGGINLSTIGDAVNAGADLLVVGSAIFAEDDYGHAIKGLESAAQARMETH